MPRKPRIEYEGAVYHVMCRGDRREPIVRDDEDRRRFFETLWEACARTGWGVHAVVAMPNHYHALIETPEPNLVAGMGWFQSTYTARFNARHREVGHLFAGRYKALVIDGDAEGYFRQVSTYIHLNPVRAGLVDARAGRIAEYPWSSARWYGMAPGRRPPALRVARVLGELGWADRGRDRWAYGEWLQGRAVDCVEAETRKDLVEEWRAIRRGWCLGDGAFRAGLVDRLTEVLGRVREGSLAGEGKRAHGTQVAEGLVREGLKRVGVQEEDLAGLRKLDARKVALAWWIRGRTTVGNRWVAERLRMGHECGVSKAVHELARDEPACRRWRALFDE